MKKNSKITIKIEKNDAASEFLYDLCLQDKPKSNGGRGIGNVIEEYFLNPLAEFVFDNNCQENDVILVKTKNGSLCFDKV